MSILKKLFGLNDETETKNDNILISEDSDINTEKDSNKIESKIEEHPKKDNLWDHISKVVLLNWCNGKEYPSQYPQYFFYKYGIKNTKKAHQELIDNMYLEKCSKEYALKTLKVSELKAYLKDSNLKQTGNKDELIQRIIDNDVAVNFNGKNIYVLSELGKNFLLDNKPWIYYHNHDFMIDALEYKSMWENLKLENTNVNGEIISLCILLHKLQKNMDYKKYNQAWINLSSLHKIFSENKDYKNIVKIATKMLTIEISGLDDIISDVNLKRTHLPYIRLNKYLVTDIKNHYEYFDPNEIDFIKEHLDYSIFEIDQIKDIFYSVLEDFETTEYNLDRLIDDINEENLYKY